MAEYDFLNTAEHEGWIIPLATNAHEGDSLNVLYCWGHNMKSCEIPQNGNLTVYAVTPEGKAQKLELISSAEDSLTYRINAEHKGIYQIIGKETGYFSEDIEGRCLKGTFEDNPEAVSATHYMHYAHTVLKVGCDFIPLNNTGVPELPLQIVPDGCNEFNIGGIFIFTLYFKDRPLPLYDIDIAYTDGYDATMHEKLITNGSGRMAYPIRMPGKYLFAVRYTSPECEEGLYYNTRYTYTFCFEAKGR